MTWRGYGGDMPRRPDQHSGAPAPGLVPGSRTGPVRTRTVIVTGIGPGSGIFVYNGTPAKGTLIADISAPGTTSDPYGNSIPSSGVLNIGTWNAAGTLLQHFGVNNSGTTFIVGTDGVTRIQINNGSGGVGPDIRFFNDFGAVILVVDPSRGGTFQYQDNNSAVQGVLIGAQVGKNTTDPINGTAVNAGVNLIDPAFGDQLTAVGAIINFIQILFTKNAVVSANTGSGATSPFLSLAGPEQTSAGHAVLRVYGKSVDGTKNGGMIVSLTDPPVRQVAEVAEVQGNIAVTGQVKAILSSALETWHVIGAGGQPPFVNSFSAGGTAPRFQLEAIGGGRARLSGSVNTGAVTAANTTMFTLPAGYVPLRQFGFVTPNNVTAYALGNASVQVTTGGAVQLVPAGTAGKFVLLDGICFELD